MADINLNDLQKRKLQSSYIAWYFFTKDIKVRTSNCIENKTLFVLYAIDCIGNREVLGLYFEKDDNRFWLEVFEDLKARGANNVLFLVTPHNHNIERCSKMVYNSVKVVISPDDVISSITKYFAEKPSRKFKVCFKNLFLAKDIKAYHNELQLFKDTYINNSVVLMLLDKKEQQISKFYEYNYEVRKLLYPYYSIHEFRKFLNKLNTLDNLCSSLNEVIEFSLEYINHFEKGRSYYKLQWLDLLSILYITYPNDMEVYV